MNGRYYEYYDYYSGVNAAAIGVAVLGFIILAAYIAMTIITIIMMLRATRLRGVNLSGAELVGCWFMGFLFSPICLGVYLLLTGGLGPVSGFFNHRHNGSGAPQIEQNEAINDSSDVFPTNFNDGVVEPVTVPADAYDTTEHVNSPESSDAQPGNPVPPAVPQGYTEVRPNDDEY